MIRSPLRRRPRCRPGAQRPRVGSAQRAWHPRAFNTGVSRNGKTARVGGAGLLAACCTAAIYVTADEPSESWYGAGKLRTDSSADPTVWPHRTLILPPQQRGREGFVSPPAIANDADPSAAGRPAQPLRSPAAVHDEKANDDATGHSITARINAAADSVTSVEWSTLGEKITGFLVPEWVKVLPGFVTKLQNELSMAPGSLADEVWQEANNPEINPEIMWDASVRISTDLCQEEKDFLQKRKKRTATALAKYLGLPEVDVHPDDVPVIAMCGSGGGLRALVSASSSYLCAKEDGLFDCITYTAGVSGSCWLQTLYYSTLTGQSHQRLINHLKNRLNVHIAYPPAALGLLSSAPTDKYLLTGLIEKLRGIPDADFGLVDIYGLLLASRLLVPKGELDVDDYDMKVSNQRRFTDYGEHPLPIYTAVRHEIPVEKQTDKDPIKAQAKAKKAAWFQWFEFTPYEFWCEELEAGIPMWAIGRKWEHGETKFRENGLALPEIRVPLMLGVWGSAFCATLSHYYNEIRPIVKSLTGFAGIDQLVTEHHDDLIKVHPVNPATIPNFALGMRDRLPSSCPESMFEATNLQLMDAGMSNNLPLYPLMRPGRNVDILIAFDASADVKTDNWLKVADSYVRERGIKGWPLGAGWPSVNESRREIADALETQRAITRKGAFRKTLKVNRQGVDPEKGQQTPPIDDMGYCNIWVGTTDEQTDEDEPLSSKRLQEESELMKPSAGMAVIYFPFLANPKVQGVDPRTSDFMSTWNFVYTPDQIDKVVALARANFNEGREQTNRAVRAVYERKKARRLEREQEEKQVRRRWKLRMGLAGKKLGEGDHANHFS